MKKIVMPLIAFMAGLIVMPNVYAAEPTPVSDIAQLNSTISSAQNGDIIKLTMEEPSVTASDIITIDKNITLDLNGKTLTSAQANTLLVQNSTVTIKNGTIKNTNPTGVALNIKTSTVTLNANVESDYTGINFPSVSGQNKSTLTIESGAAVSATNNVGLSVNGLIKDQNGNIPVINIKDGATVKCTKDFAIYQAGNSKITIGKATIEGASGIGTKAGSLVLNGTTVNATASEATAASPRGNGIESTGAAIQMETNNGYNGNIDIEINGGTYTSASNVVFLEYPKEGVDEDTAVNRLHITGGTFKAAEGKEVFDISEPFDNLLKETKSIEGGTFLKGNTPANISSYVKEGLEQDENGKVIDPNAADPNALDNVPKTGSSLPIALIGLLGLATIAGAYSLKLAYARK